MVDRVIVGHCFRKKKKELKIDKLKKVMKDIMLEVNKVHLIMNNCYDMN
jgi:hypothetical protein